MPHITYKFFDIGNKYIGVCFSAREVKDPTRWNDESLKNEAILALVKAALDLPDETTGKIASLQIASEPVIGLEDALEWAKSVKDKYNTRKDIIAERWPEIMLDTPVMDWAVKAAGLKL